MTIKSHLRYSHDYERYDSHSANAKLFSAIRVWPEPQRVDDFLINFEIATIVNIHVYFFTKVTNFCRERNKRLFSLAIRSSA